MQEEKTNSAGIEATKRTTSVTLAPMVTLRSAEEDQGDSMVDLVSLQEVRNH